MSQPEPFNLDTALRSTEGSHEVLRELAGVWREHLPATVAGIQRSIADQDGPGLARQAHQLAGALGLFGAKPSLELARQLEASGQAGRWEDATLLANQLEPELQRLLAALEQLATADLGP